MKKSFLKRVAAAAVAVPVALTQTALFTAFAVDETAGSTNKITMDSFLNITPSTAEANGFVAAPSAADYRASEIQDEVQTVGNVTLLPVVQESLWGQKVENILAGLSDDQRKFSLPKEDLADAIDREGAVYDVIKNAIRDENTYVEAEIIKDDQVVITVNFDYNYGQDMADVLADNVAKNGGAEITLKTDNLEGQKVQGRIVLTADTTKIADNKVTFEATVELGGETKKGAQAAIDYFDALVKDTFKAANADVDATAADYRSQLDDAQADLDDAQADLDAVKNDAASTAQDLADAQADVDAAQAKVDDLNAKLDASENNAKNKLADYEDKYDKAMDKYNNISEEYVLNATADTADGVLEQAVDKLPERLTNKVENRFGEIPTTIDDVTASHYYDDYMVKAFNKVINTVNERLGNVVDLTLDEIVTEVKGLNRFEVNVEAYTDTFQASADGIAYFAETDYDENDTYLTYFQDTYNDQLEALNYEVTAIKSVKAVEADGTVDASDAFTGDAALNIYRVVWPVITPIEETTESSESDTSSSSEEETPTSSETDTSETDEPKADELVITDVETDKAFYFSHDPNAFDPEELIKSVEVEGDGEMVWEHFSFGLDENGAKENLSPKDVYKYYYVNKTADGYKFEVAKPLYIYYNGEPVKDANGEQARAYAYVGVKGDANLDGVAGAPDATDVLIYAAARGAGVAAVIHSEPGSVLENFAYFLADTDTESKTGYSQETPLSAADGTNILLYAALVGSLGQTIEDNVPFTDANWIDEVNTNNGVLSPEYPEVSLKIAEAAQLIK